MRRRLQILRAHPERSTLAVADRVRLAGLQALGFRSRTVATDVGRVRVLEGRGTGPIPTVVLLHGLSSAAVDFGPLLMRLRRVAQRILAPDLPGHGGSDEPRRGEAAQSIRIGIAQALERVVDGPALCYGNSLGGLAAIRFANARPDLVGALVLASPAGARTDEEELRRVLAEFRVEEPHQVRAFVRRVLPNGHWMGPVLTWATGVRLRAAVVRELVDTASVLDTLAPHEVAGLAAPTLLLWGSEERLLPPTHLEFFRRHLPPHAVVESLAGLGHVPQLESPRLLLDRMVAFWQEHHGSRGVR